MEQDAVPAVADPNPDKQLKDYDFEVWRHPKWKGGQPTIKGTRWPVWDIYRDVEADGIDWAVENFETLTRDMAEFAVKYVLAHPEVEAYYADRE